jgi:hypothetical protein
VCLWGSSVENLIVGLVGVRLLLELLVMKCGASWRMQAVLVRGKGDDQRTERETFASYKYNSLN